MSQVMPETGEGVNDREVLPELYHQAPSATLVHNTDPSMMTTTRGVFFAGSCLWTTVAFSHQVNGRISIRHQQGDLEAYGPLQVVTEASIPPDRSPDDLAFRAPVAKSRDSMGIRDYLQMVIGPIT